MKWTGKILGGIFGFAAGNIPGLILGVFIGNFFDRGFNQDFTYLSQQQQQALQQYFFRATFCLMGRIAKADGQISENEIAAAEATMNHLGLDANLRKQAIEHYQMGKQESFDWRTQLSEFASLAKRQSNLKQMFLELQIQAALADGVVKPEEHQILQEAARILGFPNILFEQLLRMIQAQGRFHQNSRGQSQANPQQVLAEAYQALGLEKSATDQQVKRQYKKLMSQHHPDKLVARGLPEHMVKAATEKTQEIKQAYEQIMQYRKGN